MSEDNHMYFQNFVSHNLPLENAQEGFDLLLAPDKKTMKIVLPP